MMGCGSLPEQVLIADVAGIRGNGKGIHGGGGCVIGDGGRASARLETSDDDIRSGSRVIAIDQHRLSAGSFDPSLEECHCENENPNPSRPVPRQAPVVLNGRMTASQADAERSMNEYLHGPLAARIE